MTGSREELFKLFEPSPAYGTVKPKPTKRQVKLARLQRLFRFQWALKRIWACNVLWKRLAMKPQVDQFFA